MQTLLQLMIFTHKTLFFSAPISTAIMYCIKQTFALHMNNESYIALNAQQLLLKRQDLFIDIMSDKVSTLPSFTN